jgi:hypothetical protein
MLDGLSKYLGEKPRRAALVVMTLVVVLIIVVAGSLFQLLNLGSYSDPPYPSESTPLSMVDGGIRWSNPLMYETATYNRTAFYWRNETTGLGGPLIVSDDQQADLSSGSSITIVQTIAQASDLSHWINLTIYDSTGDGKPGSGDYILFTGPPHKSDIVYTIALAYVGGPSGGFAGGEFDYAIHDGNFYSWESDMDNTAPPWWYNFLD